MTMYFILYRIHMYIHIMYVCMYLCMPVCIFLYIGYPSSCSCHFLLDVIDNGHNDIFFTSRGTKAASESFLTQKYLSLNIWGTRGKKPHLTSPCFAWMERVLPQQVRTVYYLATGCHWCLLYFSNTSKCMSNSSSHHRLVSYTLVWLADQLSK